jgi:hypothetical protein
VRAVVARSIASSSVRAGFSIVTSSSLSSTGRPEGKPIVLANCNFCFAHSFSASINRWRCVLNCTCARTASMPGVMPASCS